jgi:hypothetical protein
MKQGLRFINIRSIKIIVFIVFGILFFYLLYILYLDFSKIITFINQWIVPYYRMIIESKTL